MQSKFDRVRDAFRGRRAPSRSWLARLPWLAAGGMGLAGSAALAGAATLLSRRYDFRDKSVVITGGSRGLGLVLARRFAEEGARLSILARDQDEVYRAESDLRYRGVPVFARAGDLRDEGQIAEFVTGVRDRYGRIDVLVNNAGVIQAGPLEHMTIEDYEEAMAVHFRGPLLLIEAVLPEMRERKDGRIVNIASIGGKISFPHLLPYCASKFALVGYSEGLRAALLADGIYVTTVIPGLMRTGSPRHAIFKGNNRAEYAWFSIGDSLPLLSIGAERAAAKIVRACRYGQGELVLTLPAKIATRLSGILPELAMAANALVERILPGPGGVGSQGVKGSESKSSWSPSRLTALTEAAAERNNEFS